MGKFIKDLNTAATIFPGDLFVIDNQGTSRKATLRALMQRLFGTNTQGTYRAAKIEVDQQGFVTSITGGLSVGSETIAYPEVPANDHVDRTIPAPNAAVGDCVAVGLPASFPAGLVPTAFVSAAGEVTLRMTNVTAVGITPPSAVYSAVVFKL